MKLIQIIQIESTSYLNTVPYRSLLHHVNNLRPASTLKSHLTLNNKNAEKKTLFHRVHKKCNTKQYNT